MANLPILNLSVPFNLGDLFRGMLAKLTLSDVFGTFLGTMIDVAKSKGGDGLERGLTVKESSVRGWARETFRKAGGRRDSPAEKRFEARAVEKFRAAARATREAVESIVPEPSDLNDDPADDEH